MWIDKKVPASMILNRTLTHNDFDSHIIPCLYIWVATLQYNVITLLLETVNMFFVIKVKVSGKFG